MAQVVLQLTALLSFLLSLSQSNLANANLFKRGTVVVPTNLPTNWTFAGCYNDTQGSRTLGGSTYADSSNMNASACIAYCTSKNYVYAGTEYSDECYCGNIINADASMQDQTDCDMGCSANATEACGGPNRLSTYYANKAGPKGPYTNPGPSPWVSEGCYTEGTSGRILPNAVNVAGGGANMSIALCTSACHAAGYSLAGAEYAGECYCGNYLANGGALAADQGDCNMVCNGNASEFCGAGNRLNMYSYNGVTPSSTPPVSTNAPPAGFSYLGCYNDTVGDRSLGHQQFLSSYSAESCTAACHTAGYSLAGTEYADECYCDNSFQNYATNISASSCNMNCAGNSNETCGGPGALSMYIYTGWSSLGCYNDTIGDRTLNHQITGLTGVTVELCQSACKSAGYTLAGLEYASECYCDNSFQNYGAPASDGSAGCNMNCQGNSGELCGGANRLNVYQYNSTGTSSTTTSASSGGGATSATSTPTPSSSVNATAILPFKYQGCYTDANNSGRALAYQQPDNSTLTVESCIAMCTALNYTIAGMEYADQCFCDDFIRYSSSLVSDSQCNMACAGNSAENCGAGSRLSMYSNGTMTPYILPETQTTNLPGSWQYAGCLTDADDNRALTYLITWNTNNSASTCLSQCAEYGYGAAGMEYSSQCWCGDAENVAISGQPFAQESDCDMVCTADEDTNGGYICGGADRISYYTWQGAALSSWEFATGNAAGAYEFLIGGVVIPLVTSPARNGKVTYMEKFGTEPANNSTGAYELDLAQLTNFTGAWRPMHVKSDIFCSASLTLPDKVGRQINVGGWANGATYGIRLYWPDGYPGVWGVNDWEENVNEVSLLNGRWYPTAMIMANGSILVMGGEEGSNGAPVPTLEVLPTPAGVTSSVYCDYLDRTDPYNLYPFLAVLPSGGIFVAYYNEARILDPVSLQTKTVLPNIPGAVNDFLGGRTYPFEGTSVLMPQYAPYTDPLTVMICGGSVPGPEIALDNCVSLQPDVAGANWTIERMPSKRVISCMTALPDGTFLILNGAQQGRAGFGLATLPNTNAVLYDPSKPIGQRMTVMANTTVARLYHSEAVLLDDGRVLVSGSDPEDVRAFAPQEYRNEVFMPPYLLNGNPRPAYTLASSNLDWTYGETVPLTITAPGGGGTYRISLMGAVSSTHGNSMGQRTYFPTTLCSGTTCSVQAPPNNNVCPPGWFQVYLLDGNNTPSNASWVRIGGDPAQLGNWPNFTDFTTPGMGGVTKLSNTTVY